MSSLKRDSGDDDGQLLQAVIMAESFDQRFDPITDLVPRCLLPMADQPLLCHPLEQLALSGVAETIVFTTSHAQKVAEWIKESEWSEPNRPMVVRCISNPECCSFGDAIRDLDTKGLLRGDFILIQGDTVSNVNLSSLVESHKASVAKDKNASMSLLCRRGAPGHPCRTLDQEVVIVTNGDDNRILYHQRGAGRQLEFPLEIFESPSELCFRFDLIDPGISICSAAIPLLFQDNFDFQTMDDFIKGLLENDLLDNTLYLLEVGRDYAARVSNPLSYLTVNQHVLSRWTYPFVPDMDSSYMKRHKYTYQKNNVYKTRNVSLARGSMLQKNTLIGPNSSVDKDTVITTSCIGENVSIGTSCNVEDCIILSGAVVEDHCQLQGCIIGFNAKIGHHSVVSEKCILGGGVEVDPHSKVTKDTRLVCKISRVTDDWGSDSASSDENEEVSGKYGSKAHIISRKADGSENAESESGDDDVENSAPALAKVDLWGTRLDITDDYDDDDDDGDSDSDSRDSNSGAEGPLDILLDEDAKQSAFQGYILEFLQKSKKESALSVDNLVLEINSLRHAYAVTASQVVEAIVTSVLEISAESEESLTGSKLLRQIQGTTKFFQSLLIKYCGKTMFSQRDSLLAVESFCSGEHRQAVWLPVASKTLHCLYDKDIVSDEAVIDWFEDHEASKGRVADFASTFRDKVKPFIEWLNESEEDSDEDD